jgi:hypothetical protein
LFSADRYSGLQGLRVNLGQFGSGLRTELGMALECIGDPSRQFSSLSDPCGHIVRECALAEDGKAQQVNFDLSDSPWSHVMPRPSCSTPAG